MAKSPRFELIFVMILFPGVLNVLYFWVADSYLKKKPDENEGMALRRLQRVAGDEEEADDPMVLGTTTGNTGLLGEEDEGGDGEVVMRGGAYELSSILPSPAKNFPEEPNWLKEADKKQARDREAGGIGNFNL